MRADLHCHSTYSDGSLQPVRIVDLAKQQGMDAVTITDHDTARGSFALMQEATKQGLLWISGIEISSLYENVSVHLLGYAFDTNASVVLQFEERVLESRRHRAHAIIKKLQSFGFSITVEDLLPFEKEGVSVGRPHIARLLVEKGDLPSMQEAFFRYLGEGKQAYVPHERPSVQEAVQIIHDAGGKAVLAHPQLFRNKKIPKKLIQQFDIDGIEALYCRFTGQETTYWENLAKERGLLVTGGSDFHGAGKEEIRYGVSLAPSETVDFLVEHMKRYEKTGV